MLFIDDFLLGFSRKFFQLKDNNLKNKIKVSVGEGKRFIKFSFLIWKGLFAGKIHHILLRFNWEILQTLSGFLYAFFCLWFRNVTNIKTIEGITALEGVGVQGSMSLGTYIFLYPNYKAGIGNFVWMHEFGHSLQSRISGPLYFFKYGIPSFYTKSQCVAEEDANLRAANYFEKFHHFPIQKWQRTRFNFLPKLDQPKWWEYLLLFLLIGIFIVPIINIKKIRNN